MSARIPDHKTLLSALELAVRAPSIHNTQPWRWRIGDRTVHLYTDQDRQLPATDPDERDLLISCGAVLHHARVALSSLGWITKIHRLPNPAEPTHLAAIEFSPHVPSTTELELASAITQRCSDRRPFSSWPVPTPVLDVLSRLATYEGVVLRATGDSPARVQIAHAIAEAERRQRANPGYLTELAIWSGRSAGAQDGVPVANTAIEGPYDDLTLRQFDRAGAAASKTHPLAAGGSGELVVLGTASGDRLSTLRAGEATSAVLLHAVTQGLATCPLTQPLEVPEMKDHVQAALGGGLVPQMLIRLGWPTPLLDQPPRTPRRPLAEVVEPLAPTI